MAAYQYRDVRAVHLEISSLCNAACPFCTRNWLGYPHNDGYTEHNMTLAEAREIFQPAFLTQLESILINGNFGDIVMNPEAADIVEYFRATNPVIEIDISTNGGARDSEFWIRLAKLNATVIFCLDGLDDTHHLYRRNTRWSTVINNAKIFIANGGRARWKMLVFDHNKHQVDSCQKLSEELGFWDFLPWKGNGSGPVYDRHGQYQYHINEPSRPVHFIEPSSGKQEHVDQCRDPIRDIKCEVVKDRSIYIASTGEVYPCCHLGFQPRTFGAPGSYRSANQQLASIMSDNNANQLGVEQSMQWFPRVVDSWQKPTFQQGRLVHCNAACGRDT